MWLDALQQKVFDTMQEITSDEHRFLSVEDISKALEERWTPLAQPEIFVLLGGLRTKNQIEFTWPEEWLIYTLNDKKQLTH